MAPNMWRGLGLKSTSLSSQVKKKDRVNERFLESPLCRKPDLPKVRDERPSLRFSDQIILALGGFPPPRLKQSFRLRRCSERVCCHLLFD
ncbi:hypothetical protein IE53DRAFT_235759 [Violaceomyces palustris]|uniref:Uncharacterized protein n=1 Tax=Violaceomyces palustris TaxID=1673888 RepID=A0ACD0NPD4_9BASI|nr:hypothetical protein IE53DRAFT_235759 [Violaceomyces palustris]